MSASDASPAPVNGLGSTHLRRPRYSALAHVIERPSAGSPLPRDQMEAHGKMS